MTMHFFYPEVKKYIPKEQADNIEKELFEYNSNVFEKFNENRHKGENEFYICQIIRNDSVEDFIVYINQNNIPLSSYIKHSLFETNSYLLKQEQVSLI